MENREEILKTISGLLDETIEEYENLEKAETSHKDLKLQSDENGDMPGKAGQAGDDKMKHLKKKEDEEKEEEKKEDEKKEEMEKEEECDEKEEMDKKKKKMKKSEDDAEFDRKLLKSLQRLGLIEDEGDESSITKSEDKTGEEKIEKSDAKADDGLEKLRKAQDEKLDKLAESICKVNDRLEEIAKRPAEGRRSVDGLRAIRKSEEDGATQETILDKGKVINELLDKQQAGDKRVNPQLITKCEIARTPEELKSLVQDIIN